MDSSGPAEAALGRADQLAGPVSGLLEPLPDLFDPILQPVTVIGASGYCSGEGCSGSNYGFESNCVEGCGLGAFLTAVQIDPGAGNAVQDDAYSNLDDFDGGICDTLNPVITYAPTGPVCVGTNIGADVLSLSLTFSGSACICGD